MSVNGQLNLIVGMLKDNGAAIQALDQKFDEKVDDIHERINEEVATCHKRINPVESGLVEAKGERKALRSRVNWLYFIVGGLVVGGGVALLTRVMGG